LISNAFFFFGLFIAFYVNNSEQVFGINCGQLPSLKLNIWPNIFSMKKLILIRRLFSNFIQCHWTSHWNEEEMEVEVIDACKSLKKNRKGQSNTFGGIGKVIARSLHLSLLPFSSSCIFHCQMILIMNVQEERLLPIAHHFPKTRNKQSRVCVVYVAEMRAKYHVVQRINEC
jgi:hypothetical protein